MDRFFDSGMRFWRLAGFAVIACAAATSVHAAQPEAAAGAKKRLLVLGQGPDGHHPTATHEYMAGVRVIEGLLAQHPQVEVTTAKIEEPWTEGPDLIRRADGVVLYVCEAAKLIAQDPRRQDAVVELLDRGGGLVGLHWGIGAKDEVYAQPFLSWLGGMHNGPDRKYRFLETELTPAESSHPIAAGIEPFRIHDEFYYDLKFVAPPASARPVLHAAIDGEPRVVAWTYERPGGGRSFGFSGLHFHRNWKRPEYRRLVAQGILWSLGLTVPNEGVNVELPEEVYALPPATR